MKTFIITRDRVSYARRCLASLTRYHDIEPIIVDHGSTYEPMLDWLHDVGSSRDATGVQVIRMGDRLPRDLWPDVIRDWCPVTEPYIVTDCDIELPRSVPRNWVVRLRNMLEWHQSLIKCGLALDIRDLPDTELASKVRKWEQPFWENRMEAGDGNAFVAPIDTTIAMYRPFRERPIFDIGAAIRIGGPYTARHMPWYETGPESEELRWYREHALQGASHWLNPEAWR